jgi:TonB family protein
MEAFALYLLKSVIWLSGFSLVYLLFLRNERFFLLNRLYLLSGILTSFLFPFISVHYTVVLPVVPANQPYNSQIGLQIAGYGKALFPGLLLSVAYLAGVVIVIFTKLRQNKPVLKAIKNAKIITSYPVKLIRTTDFDCSFSFFSYVFVNPSITNIETEEIVNHELAHIRQRHWFDLVLVELLCILQWFNPLAWIYIRFIRQNHEYLADEVALQRTSDPAVYKATLLNQIVGSPVVSLVNSFNYSLNKKRFNMMKNIITSPYRKLKIFLILPVFAIVLYSFAKPDYKYIYTYDRSGKSNPVSTVFTKEVKGFVVREDGTPLEGAAIVIKGKTIGCTSDSKGFFRLDNLADEDLLVVSYVGFKSIVIKPDFKSEMTIKMERQTVVTETVNIPPPPPPPVDSGGNINPPPPPPPPPPPSNGESLKSNENKEVLIEEMPMFPGGENAMLAWISDNLKYPAEAVKNKITGMVYVNFVVSSTGKIKNVKIRKSVNSLLDAEAVRVVKSMPDWTPGKQNGKPVDVDYAVPVNFKLQ